MQKILPISFSVIIIVFVLAFSIQLVFAWTEPSASPPGGNVAAPINISGNSQTKTGNLILPNIYLNAVGNEGNLYSTNIVQGFNDLILYGNASKNVPIYLEGNPVVINNDAGTGNVGIGTASPQVLLHLNGAYGRIRLDSTNGGTNNWGLFPDSSPAGFQIVNLSAGTTPFFISNGGNVGIGTASPRAYAALDVNTTGGKSIYTMDSSGGGLLIGYQGSNIQARQTNDGNNQNLVLQRWGGNVGIGSDPSASYRLDVAGYVRGQTGLCINTDCRTSWPAAGGNGTVTSLSPGSNIVLSPNPITTSGTISTSMAPTFDDAYVNSWFRVNGGGGIYWQTYGGGWYMQDTTWMRSYNSKNVYVDQLIRADNGYQIDGYTTIDGSADYWYGYQGKEMFRTNDSWLRLNQGGSFGSGTYTPYGLRADGGLAAGGYSLAGGEVRAALFRDGDSGYYVDPASGSNLGGTLTNNGSIVVNNGYVYAYNNVYPIRLGELWGHTGLYNGSASHWMYFASDQAFQFLNRSGSYGPGVYAQDYYSNAAGRWFSTLSSWLNQSVTTGASPTFNDIYSKRLYLTGRSAGNLLAVGDELSDDWLRINRDSSFGGTALYNPVAIGSGGLSVGDWSRLGSGDGKFTGSLTLGNSDPTSFLYHGGSANATNDVVLRCDGNNCYIWPWGTPSANQNVYIGGATAVNLRSFGDVQGSRLCIGGDCRSNWPGGGGLTRCKAWISGVNRATGQQDIRDTPWNASGGADGVSWSSPASPNGGVDEVSVGIECE